MKRRRLDNKRSFGDANLKSASSKVLVFDTARDTAALDSVAEEEDKALNFLQVRLKDLVEFSR